MPFPMKTPLLPSLARLGLQGIRLLAPTLGEKVVVSGLGLIGLMTVQMLRAHGCQVLGIDFDERKLELARQFGAETVNLKEGQDPVKVAENWTQGVGVDGVIITASTKSDELIHQAATMCRKRGRIVLVGVIGLNLQRADFYEKELSFQVSCSYGPGRYDDNYEKRGMDYPIGFVRWTEKRNFEAVLQLMADGILKVEPLITHRFAFDNALQGYEAVNENGAMGIVLEYSEGEAEPDAAETSSISLTSEVASKSGSPSVAFIGAGGFTTRMLLPLLPNSVQKHTIVSGTGVSAAHAGKKFGFQNIGSDASSVFQDSQIDAVFITTPHNTHARMVCQALENKKHVFVEKPLAMNREELAQVETSCAASPENCLMVGFNRRFSPHMKEMNQWLGSTSGAKSVIITVNAGAIPAEHWTQDLEVGGGRIIGEACHFIDLARFLVGHSITSTHAFPISSSEGRLGDCAAIQLTFADGSIATIHYLANGSKSFPKERIEVFASGKVLACDNFRITREIGGKRKCKTRSQDKGHKNELIEFVRAIREGGQWPISAEELWEVSSSTLTAAEQISEQITR